MNIKIEINLAFVLVLYKTKINESETFISLLNAAKYGNTKLELIIYDNSPLFNLNFNCSLEDILINYIADFDNSGVSKAYNEAYKLAKKRNKKWLVLLDQDTSLPLNIINEYLNGIKEYPEINLFVPIIRSDVNNKIISPCVFKFKRGFYSKNINVGLNSLNGYSVINCGICVSINSFSKLGGYNEKIKLDFSDFEFIERFKLLITLKYVVINCQIYHSLSTLQKPDLDQDKNRFSYYLLGSKYLKNNKFDALIINFNSFLRALKLSVRHKTFFFLSKFLLY